ncbi:MAG: hypothetical protein U5R14_08230 [Gemmatimonadota bacterium]|nr:hypothetical protein [Gemmatimonadota bacterium]
MALRHARHLILIGMAAFVLPGCEDDPILPPQEREPEDEGSYGVMMFDLEVSGTEATPADSSRTHEVRSRHQNPRIF